MKVSEEESVSASSYEESKKIISAHDTHQFLSKESHPTMQSDQVTEFTGVG